MSASTPLLVTSRHVQRDAAQRADRGQGAVLLLEILDLRVEGGQVDVEAAVQEGQLGAQFDAGRQFGLDQVAA
jgi:hypothetical protein